MDKINFVLAGDGNYANQIIVVMTSILVNHPQRDIAFHLLVNGFNKDDINKICAAGNTKHSEVAIYHMEDYDKGFESIDPRKSHNPHVSMASNYRLIITKILPVSVSKCFYVDSDMVVDDDISDIYDSMKETELAMIVPEIYSMEHRESILSRLNDWEEFEPFQRDPLSYPYFNAGFFLLNVELARKIDMFSMINDFISKHDYIPYTDQDILNAIIGQKRPGGIRLLSPSYDVFWNTDHYYRYSRTSFTIEEIQNAFDKPIVVHYCGSWKPWDCGAWPHYELWWKYAKMSISADYFFVDNKRELSDISYDAMRYHYGWGVNKDLRKSMNCIMILIHSGINQAIPYAIDTAKELNDPNSIHELIPSLSEQAKKGDGECAARLAQIYRDGLGVDSNLNASIHWFKKAIELKISWCKPELFDVLKLKSDEYQKEMFEIASSGANDGNARSMIQLSYCYKNGIGTEIDEEKSIQLINSALTQDSSISLNDIQFSQCSKKLLIKMLVSKGFSSIKNDGIGATLRRMKQVIVKKIK